MKRIALTLCSATLLLISCNNNADDKTKTDTATPADTAKKMADAKTETPPAVTIDSATAAKNWMTFSTPGEVHKMIASWNGTWKTDITLYEPGKPPKNYRNCS